MEELIVRLLWQGVSFVILVMVDKLVVRRRDAVVRSLRRLQAALHLPTGLHVVSDTEPGITNQTLRLGAELVVFNGICSFGIFAIAEAVWKVKSVWAHVAAIAIPACMTAAVWIYFICARRRFDRGERDTYDIISGDRNPGLYRSLDAMAGGV
ncbi:hypothetical protein F5Y14DRAFT_453147 [Nemania sp. NC0429]|nr:hypothetical protein F5Y14DRAFT_453147 [Nemania sp. NC0429]